MSLLSLSAEAIAQKAIDKIIAKETKKQQDKTVASQIDTYYNGIYTFGMDTYITAKVTSRIMYAIAIMLILFGLIGAFLIATLGILFGLFTHFFVKISSKRFGFILYTNDYLKIFTKGGKITNTMSISGLKSIKYKYPNYIFSDHNQSVKIISGGGKGFAAFIDHLNERRPELIETFFQNKNVSNAYHYDKNGMHKY